MTTKERKRAARGEFVRVPQAALDEVSLLIQEQRETIDALKQERAMLAETIRVTGLRLTELNEPGGPLGTIRDDLYAAFKLAKVGQ